MGFTIIMAVFAVAGKSGMIFLLNKNGYTNDNIEECGDLFASRAPASLSHSPLTVSYPAAIHWLIPPAILVTFSKPAAFKISRPEALRLPERQ